MRQTHLICRLRKTPQNQRGSHKLRSGHYNAKQPTCLRPSERSERLNFLLYATFGLDNSSLMLL